jgi:AAA domain
MTESATVSELIEQAKRDPLEWIVPNVALEDGVHILHGREECFKTMLTLQLHEVLTLGGSFLLREVKGGLRTGIAELEMKNRQFGHRLAKFFPNVAPDIRVLPDKLRRDVLNSGTARDRIRWIVDWANAEGLEFVSIDSAVKLFPAGCDLNKPDIASDVFSQLQRLPTLWIIAHDRKSMPGIAVNTGNAEIAGSGRFAQDPDVVHQMIRPDGRAPRVQFHWGKMRDGEKCDPIELFFDRKDYRLYPLHPYLHLLQRKPMLGTELVAEAATRYGWAERRARDYLPDLLKLANAHGKPCVSEQMDGHNKRFEMVGAPVSIYSPPDLVQGCSNSRGLDQLEPSAAIDWGARMPGQRD